MCRGARATTSLLSGPSQTCRAIRKQKLQAKEIMCKKNEFVRLLLVSLTALSLTASQDLFAQACLVCPPGATDSAVAVGLSAFRINPDGSTGAPIGGGVVGICQKIRLR